MGFPIARIKYINIQFLNVNVEEVWRFPMEVFINNVCKGQYLHQLRRWNLYLADSGDSLGEVFIRGIA